MGNRLNRSNRGLLDESLEEQPTARGEQRGDVGETAATDITEIEELQTSTTRRFRLGNLFNRRDAVDAGLPEGASRGEERRDAVDKGRPKGANRGGRRGYVGETAATDIAKIKDPIESAYSKCIKLHDEISKRGWRSKKDVMNSLTYIMDVLQFVSTPRRSPSLSSLDFNKLKQISNREAHTWLVSTFTQCEPKPYSEESSLEPADEPADASESEQYWKSNVHDMPIYYPEGVHNFFETQLDKWDCDIFQLDSLTNGQPLKYMGRELFSRYGFVDEYKIPKDVLIKFLEAVEQGYTRHDNPYHNSIHAADVTQTLHCLIKMTNPQNWLSSIEILSMIFAAMIHDLEHTGTSNEFHVKTRSEIASCYYDVSVLENHHLSKAFSLLAKDTHDIFENLPKKKYKLLKSLVIEMVLATDMSKHLLHVKHWNKLADSRDAWSQIQNDKKPKVLSLFLHMADISHPGKNTTLHKKWSDRLQEEFFKQGDQEKEMGIPCSPLCDRNNTTAIPESQKGFIDMIVEPAYEACGDVMELIVKKQLQVTSKDQQTDTDGDDGDQVKSKIQPTGASNKEECSIDRPWEKYIKENKENWWMKSQQKSTTAKDDGDDSKEESAKDTK